MNLCIQGMRRSGTTFLFDILCADERFDAFYEPLAAAKRSAVGGGSRMRNVDFFAQLRVAREQFIHDHHCADPGVMNWGAPADPEREIDADFPPVVREYLQFLATRQEHTLFKFVRCATKVPELQAILPRVKLIHIVRDPRAVATSFLFGKGRKYETAFRNPHAFFTHDGTREGPHRLQAIALANVLIECGLTRCPPDAPSHMKILALWQFSFRRTHEDAGAFLRDDDYLRLQHETLLNDPQHALARIYRLWNESPADTASAWTAANIDPTPRIAHPDDERWNGAFLTLHMHSELREAGYAHLTPEHGP